MDNNTLLTDAQCEAIYLAVARDLLELAGILDMSGPKKHKDDRIDIMWDVMTAAARRLREHAATLTRPAAQVAATRDPDLCDHGAHPADGGCAQCIGKDATPKHDDAQNDALTWMRAQAKALGMVAAEDANAFYLARFIAPHIKFPTPKHDEGREEVDAYREFHHRLDCLLGERLEITQHGDYKAAIENTIRSVSALASQPAARRVTDDEVLRVLGYTPGPLDESAPQRVWLQIDTFGDNDERGELWPGSEHVTWQDESIGGLEIVYVRADLHAALQAERDALRKKVGELDAQLGAAPCRGANADGKPRCIKLAYTESALEALREQMAGEIECVFEHVTDSVCYVRQPFLSEIEFDDSWDGKPVLIRLKE